ncbi:hypothetical protein FUAX_17220 [Fulvitalea axinellae]|uniref:Transposase IS30-like HTH domain-containing protein n=1 Tax=Fulvitalea axinellae TaxID=1182444 RepID=A0AAU9CJ09_9BACT|nr:hypothetical protein FUAX_17220 [Fulvitalea axinellae]
MSQLNITHRARIFLGIREGKTDAEIARVIGFHRSTVGREIQRNGGREGYDLWKAQGARDRRQGLAVLGRMLFGGGVPFNSRLRKRDLKYAYFSYAHIHWYDFDQDRFFRKSETWRHQPYVRRRSVSVFFGFPKSGRMSLGSLEKEQGADKSIRRVEWNDVGLEWLADRVILSSLVPEKRGRMANCVFLVANGQLSA